MSKNQSLNRTKRADFYCTCTKEHHDDQTRRMMSIVEVMMNKMIRVLWLCCVTMLNVSTTSASEYMLMSTQEEAMIHIPFRLYHMRTTEPCLSLVAEISPQKGIRLVAAYPQQRKVAIWRYEENRTGSLVIVDVDMPEDRRSTSLPFEPVLGGYLMKGAEGESLFVAWKPSKIQDQLYAYSMVSDHLQPIQTAQWDTAIIHGANKLRRGGGRLLNVVIDPESGEISYYSGNFRSPLPFRFDEATLQTFNRFETRATLVWGNDEKTCVVGAQEKGEDRKYFFIFIYDKILQHWNHLTVEGVYSHIRFFDNWILIQQALQDKETPRRPSILTGKYTFYQIDSGEQFQWQSESQTEVLGIWGNTILYRRDDELFEAKIAGTAITEARMVCKDPAIQDVHWAFIVP